MGRTIDIVNQRRLLMNNDDLPLQSYQDDINADDNAIDPAMEEMGENPAEEIGIPEEVLANELNDLAIDEHKEDATAQIEAADQETDQDYGKSSY